jgi:hypothetical protein
MARTDIHGDTDARGQRCDPEQRWAPKAVIVHIDSGAAMRDADSGA